jgi:hypothetical protein
VFLIFYIINQVNIIGRNDVTIQYASTDNSTVSVPLQGVLCFSEQRVNPPSGYSCVAVVNDGFGVSQAVVLGNLYSASQSDTLELVTRINREIAYLELCADVRGGKLDNVDYEKQVKDSYAKLIDMINEGNFSSSVSMGDEWLVAKSKRNVSIGVISSYTKQIERLTKQKEELLSGIEDYYHGKFNAPMAGVYYGYTDGYENLLTSSLAEGGDYEELRVALNGELSAQSDDNAMGKIVTSGKWYTVCSVSSEVASGLKVGASYSAEFEENGEKVSLVLERTVAEYKSDTVMLVFSSNADIGEFTELRYVNFKLTVGSYLGLGVPCSAVRYVDGKVGVYIVDGNKARFREIDIVAESGGRYIVVQHASDSEEYSSHLKLYDSVIISGKNVYDGRYVELAG